MHSTVRQEGSKVEKERKEERGSLMGLRGSCLDLGGRCVSLSLSLGVEPPSCRGREGERERERASSLPPFLPPGRLSLLSPFRQFAPWREEGEACWIFFPPPASNSLRCFVSGIFGAFVEQKLEIFLERGGRIKSIPAQSIKLSS